METTEERRKRLQAMRAAVQNTSDSVNSSNNNSQQELNNEHASKKVKLRNYVPKDSSIGAKEENEKLEENENDKGKTAASVPVNGDIIKSELAQLQTEEINIVPKHPNFDLKQGIQQRLEKLKKRTQRSIVEILREKIASTAE